MFIHIFFMFVWGFFYFINVGWWLTNGLCVCGGGGRCFVCFYGVMMIMMCVCVCGGVVLFVFTV